MAKSTPSKLANQGNSNGFTYPMVEELVDSRQPNWVRSPNLPLKSSVPVEIVSRAPEVLSEPSLPSSGGRNLPWSQETVIWAIGLSILPLALASLFYQTFPEEFGTLYGWLILGGITALVGRFSATFFTQRLMRPLRAANDLITQLGQGKLTAAPSDEDEMTRLESNLKQLSSHLQVISEKQTKLTQQRQLFSSIAFRTRQAPTLEVLFETTVQGGRQWLGADRVVIYRFNPDWTGTMIAEAVNDGFPKVLNETIGDPCFRQRNAAQYQNGRIRAINDILTEPGMTDCHIRLLQEYAVRANLVAPIRKDDRLYGLLIAHQCTGPRVWTEADFEFVSQLTTEVEYSLDYLSFIAAQNATTQRSWFFGEIAFLARQSLNLDDVFQTTVQGARKILGADRVMVYRFNPDWTGTMIAESVAEGWPRVLDEKIDDPCFRGRYVELYKNGRVRAINNIREEPGLTDCHIRTLEKYAVKANLVAPLRKEGELMGLLIAHQCSAPKSWQESDLEFFSQVATQVEYAIDHLNFIDKIQATVGRARLFGDIAFRARQSLSQSAIFRVATQGAIKTLKADRVLIYRFNPDFSGTMVEESVLPGWPHVLNERIDDPCFRGRYVELYKNGRVRAINDIYRESSLTDCHIRLLEQYEIKANLVAPIRLENKLFGLLIAHQCSGPRIWQKAEIDFMAELAVQVEYALDHVSFIDKLEQAREQAEQASQEQRQQKEAIQAQLAALLTDAQGAVEGDLTVRVRQLHGEIGTVSDFLNATVQNLQKIVLQVQSASASVNHTAYSSERQVGILSQEALRQAEATTLALGQIQAIAKSIQGIAANAQTAKLKVQQADQTLQEGDQAMNLTVDGILAIQETVEETAEKVKRLGEASQKISRVVTLIRDLASQTHVLALNAAIEANGSNEDHGFAVVADEVRSLAERSTAATREIEQVLEEIQTETNQVVTAMEDGLDQVIAGTELVEVARHKLTSIATVSGQIRSLVEDMAQAATDQTETSTSVSSTMQEVEIIAQMTSKQAVEVAASFTKLLGVAQELEQSVAQFKVQ
jgi:methyl-accepting chemotaxis protein PixJ